MTKALQLLDRMKLEEASISRMIKSLGKDFTLITAFRASDGKDANRTKNRDMIQKFFRPIGAGGTAVKGSWVEQQADGTKKEVSEESFLVQKPAGVSAEEFRAVVLKAIKEYNQDAAVIGIDGKVQLLFQNGETKEIGSKAELKDGDLEGAFTRFKGYKVKFETYTPQGFAQALEADQDGLKY